MNESVPNFSLPNAPSVAYEKMTDRSSNRGNLIELLGVARTGKRERSYVYDNLVTRS